MDATIPNPTAPTLPYEIDHANKMIRGVCGHCYPLRRIFIYFIELMPFYTYRVSHGICPKCEKKMRATI